MARLLTKYAFNELDPIEKQELVESALDDQDFYNELAQEQMLAALFDDREFRREVEAAAAAHDGWTSRLREWLAGRLSTRRLMLSTAMVLGIVCLIVVFVWQRRESPRPESAITAGQRPLVRGPALQASPEAKALPLLATVLHDTNRDDTQENIVRLPAQPRMMSLAMPVSPAFAGVAASLTRDHQVVATFKSLKPTVRPGSDNLASIQIPSTLLHPGYYLIQLTGTTFDRHEALAGAFSFRVTQP